MMKRICMVCLMVLALACSVVGCGGNDDPASESGTDSTVVSDTESSEVTEQVTEQETEQETEDEETPLDSWTHNY